MARICAPSPLACARPNWRGYSRDGHFRVRQARVPFGGTVLASVAGGPPRGPQFMRITPPLRLPAPPRCQPDFPFPPDRPPPPPPPSPQTRPSPPPAFVPPEPPPP